MSAPPDGPPHRGGPSAPTPGPAPAVVTTLAYVRRGGRTLMMHRVKKADDVHRGRWNGLGGKLEPGESPEACMRREVLEESGLRVRAARLRGTIAFPAFAGRGDRLAFVYVVDEADGELIDSPEGVLAWVDDADLLGRPLWAGDRVFLPWLGRPGTFEATFRYREGVLIAWEAVFR